MKTTKKPTSIMEAAVIAQDIEDTLDHYDMLPMAHRARIIGTLAKDAGLIATYLSELALYQAVPHVFAPPD